MAQPTRTRALLRVDVLKKIDPISEPKTSTSTGGSTTTLQDTELAPAAESEDFVGDWIYVAETQGSGPIVGVIVRVTAVDFSGTNSVLTVAPTVAAIETGMDYERHRKVRPNIINDRLDVILGLLRQNVTLPVTVVDDGDMEDTGTITDNWTVTTATQVKDTTNVRHGGQSIKVTSSSDDGFTQSNDINLPANTQVIVSADVFITNGDSAKLIFYDVTNSANIGTPMESDETGWVHLENTFTTPATAERVAVRLESQTSGDVIYWDHVTVWPTLDKGIDLPGHLEFLSDVQSMFFYPVGTGIAGSTNVNAYRINEGAPQFYAHSQKELDDIGIGASRFYVPSRIPTNALWIKGRKPFPVFAGSTDALKDADTTQANRYVVVNMTAASILDDLALEAMEAEKDALAQNLQGKALLLRFEIQHILNTMTPPGKKTITTPFTKKRV